MRVVTFLVPGSGMISSDVIAKIAMELNTESPGGDIRVNQWTTEESVVSDTPTIDTAVRNAVDIIESIEGDDLPTTIANIAVASRTADQPKALISAIKLIATYDKPTRLSTYFGLSKHAIKACKDLYNSGYVS